MESFRPKKQVFILLIITVILISLIIYISDHLVRKLSIGPEVIDALVLAPFIHS